MEPERLARLVQPAATKIVLLVLDGVGDLRNGAQPHTPLEEARTPNLDALAARSSLGRIVPVAPGITPGSGPGHLALFGYDPLSPRADIGRGVLEALGAEVPVGRGDVAARGNFATADAEGDLSDRRAGRISTEEGRRLAEKLRSALPDTGEVQVRLQAGEGHRFVLVLSGPDLSPAVADTDPQAVGRPPLEVRATAPEGEATAALVRRLVETFQATLADEPQANRALLRGFSTLPELPSLPELYRMRFGAFAGYPLYRGVAASCGMQVVPCGKTLGAILETVGRRWDDFDFFFLHVKQTDQAGEDGNFSSKVQVLEEVDEALPALLELEADVVAVTGDHSTPSPMASHSWHPVPLLIAAETAFADGTHRFDEVTATHGHLGTLPSRHLMALLLAHAGRLAKFGA